MRVVIIGAGIAGAAAARMLAEHGAEPIVLEAGDAIGGRTRTVEHEGFRIDTGAIFVMGSYARTLEYLEASGHAGQTHRWAARTAVLDDQGRKHAVRLDRPWTLLRMPQLSWRDRLRACARIAALAARRGPGPFTIADLAGADDGQTLAQWSRKNVGDTAFEYVVRPLMDPLTGADPGEISAAFTVALMHQVTKTQLTVPQGGMGSIAEWLLEGVEVRLDARVSAVTADRDGVHVDVAGETIEADALVVATDVLNAAALLDRVVDPAIVNRLAAVRPIRAHHVLFGYRRDPWPHAPYDLVVRAGRGMHHNYGVLLNGRRAPASVPRGGQTVSIYLDSHQTAGLAEAEVVARAREGVDAAFGPAEPDFHLSFRMDVALIAPTPGHYASMLAARDAMPDRVRLAGDFLTHSGIEGALLSGEQAARDVLSLRRAQEAPSAVHA